MHMNIRHSPPGPPCARATLAAALLLAFSAASHAAPTGGVVAAGSASIAANGTTTTITQASQNTVINWQGFGIKPSESVRFNQPNAAAVALNRVLGAEPSAIFGTLSANGKVFLVNPNGILFGPGASVNVGALAASTLDIGDSDFMAQRYRFAGDGPGSVVNDGTLRAEGGYVALLGTSVSNRGTISARLGSVALAAGQAITLDLGGDGLLNVAVDRGAVGGLVHNGGLVQADGGRIVLTAQGAGDLLSTAVNNSGVIQAQTLSSRNGTIQLLASLQGGTISVGGTLDASAPHGGNGGFIETSAARVVVLDGARVTTAAATGRTGEWLIDPEDFNIGGGATDNISGATLSALLVTNSVTIATSPGPDATVAGTPPLTSLHTATVGNGDINVKQAVSWSAAPSTTTLTLNATRDVNISSAITATNGNLVVCCGRDVNVTAPIVTTNGSVLLSAGRNANLLAALTTTDGNIMICAATDVMVNGALTLTRGSSIPAQSLGLPTGLVLSAGNSGTGPGEAAGTVRFGPLTPPAAVTGPNAAVVINYNPIAYLAPTNYLPHFTLTAGASLAQHMLVYGVGDKNFDGTTATTLSGLRGSPAGVTLVAGPAAAANFDTAAVGLEKPITFTGYTLGGPAAASFALPVPCCGPAVAHTTGNILALALPPVPVPIPPVPVAPVPVPVPVVPPPVVVVVPPPIVQPPPVVVQPPPVVQVPPVVQPPPAVVPPPAVQPPPVVVMPPVVQPPPVAQLPDLPAPVTLQVVPQFAPFVVAPVLLQTPGTLLEVTLAPPENIALVERRQAVPVAMPVVPEAAPAPVPAAPYVAPVRPAKPFRN
jgi:filamentous hemagglutinin family protein